MRTPSATWTAWSTALLLASPTTAQSLVHPRLRARQVDDTTFDWSSITPTADLQYHDCYGTFKCARLQVPLDWTTATGSNSTQDTTNQQHAAIAIVTLPAAVPPTDPSYGGPLLINPGGPGGEGTTFALSLGATIQALGDTPGKKHFDILGFDPRGVGRSTPGAPCYEQDFDRTVNLLQTAREAPVQTAWGLRAKFEMARGMTALCKGSEAGQSGIMAHMSTADVARDMLEIVERVEEANVKAGKGKVEGNVRLNYLGFSYGSQLGNTFASMFPGRVGRMVVDGIVDADDYVSGTWQKNLNDAEKAVDTFYKTCFAAGDACPLRIRRDKSYSDIRKRVNALIQSLVETPVSAVHQGRIYMITSKLVTETIRQSLYDPIGNYEMIATALGAALAGNYTLMLSTDIAMPVQPPAMCQEVPATSPAVSYTWADEASAGIACGDSFAMAGQRNNLTWARDLTKKMIKQSPTFGEAWARLPMSCTNWQFNPPYAFHGPFGSPAPNALDAANTPAAPLLILSTRVDHATPLRNAYTLQKLHGGSSVIVQESVGHCALLSSSSQCTYGHVREYLLSGKVPANGTVCAADCVAAIPFKACPGFPSVSG